MSIPLWCLLASPELALAEPPPAGAEPRAVLPKFALAALAGSTTADA